MMWETQAEDLIAADDGTVCGVKVRKQDGRLSSIIGKRVMLACGGFEGKAFAINVPSS